jgi:hypothetical protein
MSLRISASPLTTYATLGAFAVLGTGLAILAKKLREYSSTDRKLIDLTNRYVEFINQVSQGEQTSHPIDTLFSPNCKKMLNGATITTTSKAFVSELTTLQSTHGCWKVTPLDTIYDTKKNTVVLRLIIEMNGKSFTGMVILRSSAKHRIKEINEVFNEVKGSYGFKNPRNLRIKIESETSDTNECA